MTLDQKARRFLAALSHRVRGTKDESEEIVEELQRTRSELERLETLFALETDKDLMDAVIYQKEALLARSRYLHRRAKELGATRAAQVGDEPEQLIS